MERKTFMRNLGDVLLCISIVMLCILCVVMEYRVRGLEKRLSDAEINIAAVGNTNEEIKTTVDEIASNTDAQYESINQKLDEYQGDVDELSKTVEELTTGEVTEEETTEEQTTEESKDSAVISTPKQIASNPTPAPEPEPEPEVEENPNGEEPEVEESSDGGNYAGTYQITAYTWTGNPCSDGVYPSSGYTAAANDPALWHKWIYVDGIGEVYVHDHTGVGNNVIDIYMDSEAECVNWGRQTRDVYFGD